MVTDLDDLLSRLARGVAQDAAGAPLPRRLCLSAVQVLECDGGAITMAYTLPERVTLATTDDTALILEETQDLMAQGPGAEAFTSGDYRRLDLRQAPDTDPRWPLLRFDTAPNLAPLVVHALPMAAREVVVGVLTLYQRGVDRAIDLEAAALVAKVVTAALVADGPGQLSADDGPWSARAEVHQATGMVIAQLHVPEADALALIRAHAYSHDQSVTATAHAVVTGGLRFSASPDREIEST